jgi:hypothetical protein
MKIWKKARGAKASLARPDFARDFGRFCSKATLKRRKRTNAEKAILKRPKDNLKTKCFKRNSPVTQGNTARVAIKIVVFIGHSP